MNMIKFRQIVAIVFLNYKDIYSKINLKFAGRHLWALTYVLTFSSQWTF